MQLAPQLVSRDPAFDVDRADQLGVGQVAEDLVALGADHGQAAGNVLDQGAEGGEQDRQPLALLGPTDEEDPQLLPGAPRRARRRLDVDAVGDDRVVAAEPATAGPGGGLGDGDPGREAVEHAAGAEARWRCGWGRPWSSRCGRCRRPASPPLPGSRSSRPAAPAARARGPRRSRRGARRGAARSSRWGRPRGWRSRRWRRSPPCGPAASRNRPAHAVRRRPGAGPGLPAQAGRTAPIRGRRGRGRETPRQAPRRAG